MLLSGPSGNGSGASRRGHSQGWSFYVSTFRCLKSSSLCTLIQSHDSGYYLYATEFQFCSSSSNALLSVLCVCVSLTDLHVHQDVLWTLRVHGSRTHLPAPDLLSQNFPWLSTALRRGVQPQPWAPSASQTL